MKRAYVTEYACQYCDWHISRLATSQLNLMADEEALELVAAEHLAKVHPNSLETPETQGEADG